MTGARDITQLCFSSNLAGIVANKIEQSFYSVYSYSRIESIEHTLVIKPLQKLNCFPKYIRDITFPQKFNAELNSIVAHCTKF